MKRYMLVLLTFFILSMTASAQNNVMWDDASSNSWNSKFEEVNIPSSKDGSLQKAFIYRSQKSVSQPLIVSLHTWSGDYTQRDPLVDEIVARDWNYIHPDFRGPNRTFDSMGSQFVLSDIEDAIRFALKNTHADPDNVHIIGVSGGGFATLAAYMNIDYPVKSFSAWAPISDIEAWYWESVGRQQKYAKDIINAISVNGVLNSDEAVSRSPLKQAYPILKRKDAQLCIYEGVHDGYSGSVPITHSINMYNRLVGELKYGTSNMDTIMFKAAFDSDLVSAKEIVDLVTKRINPKADKNQTLFGRAIYLFRKYENIQLTIFEGRHEQLPQALSLIPYKETHSLRYNILTIGDSNGANEGGWPDQLKGLLPKSCIINLSQSGRCIGFDNNGKSELNALSHIESYLDKAKQLIGNKKYDYIIVCLGTNDVKYIYSGRQTEIVSNFELLLSKIKGYKWDGNSVPKIIYVTPPPLRVMNIKEKYKGGNQRLSELIPEFEAIAQKKEIVFVDIYNPLQKILDVYATDGVHMDNAGQQIVASQIVRAINIQK